MLNAAKQQKAILDNETWWNIILNLLKGTTKVFHYFSVAEEKKSIYQSVILLYLSRSRCLLEKGR